MRNRSFAPDRYEAAIRLERIRQQIRENARYGFPITNTHRIEVQEAEAEYDLATNVLEGWVTPVR